MCQFTCCSPARHGFLAREIELMVENGMTPQAALEASTKAAADLLGIQDQVGTIEVGKRAGMVLMKATPLGPGRPARHLGGVPGRQKNKVGIALGRAAAPDLHARRFFL